MRQCNGIYSFLSEHNDFPAKFGCYGRQSSWLQLNPSLRPLVLKDGHVSL